MLETEILLQWRTDGLFFGDAVFDLIHCHTSDSWFLMRWVVEWTRDSFSLMYFFTRSQIAFSRSLLIFQTYEVQDSNRLRTGLLPVSVFHGYDWSPTRVASGDRERASRIDRELSATLCRDNLRNFVRFHHAPWNVVEGTKRGLEDRSILTEEENSESRILRMRVTRYLALVSLDFSVYELRLAELHRPMNEWPLAYLVCLLLSHLSCFYPHRSKSWIHITRKSFWTSVVKQFDSKSDLDLLTRYPWWVCWQCRWSMCAIGEHRPLGIPIPADTSLISYFLPISEAHRTFLSRNLSTSLRLTSMSDFSRKPHSTSPVRTRSCLRTAAINGSMPSQAV